MKNEENKLANLFEIADSINIAPPRTQRYGVWYQLIIGIGNDHTAYVTLDEDALKTLCDRNNMNFEEVIAKEQIKDGV